MLRLGGEVDGAAEYVEHAPVHVVADVAAQVGVEGFRIPAPEFGNVANAEAVQIGGDGRPDAGDTLEPVYLSDHTASSFPAGSVKWKRRPPGKEKISLTIAPPAAWIFVCIPARSAV